MRLGKQMRKTSLRRLSKDANRSWNLRTAAQTSKASISKHGCPRRLFEPRLKTDRVTRATYLGLGAFFASMKEYTALQPALSSLRAAWSPQKSLNSQFPVVHLAHPMLASKS